MNIGNRIRKLRKELDLTQTEFATRIGSVQNTVTGYESGRRNPSAPVVSLICREFNVNENWLRTGEGNMFNPSVTSTLETLAQERNLSANDCILIEKFLNLNQSKRDAITSYIMECAAEMNSSDTDATTGKDLTSDIPDTPEELEKICPPIDNNRTSAG